MIPLFLTAGPNEVLVVSGVGLTEPNFICGGRTMVFTCLHTWERLSLNVMTIEIDSPGVYTKEGVPINVSGAAQVKIASTPKPLMIRACEHFLSMKEKHIKHLIRETLEGHQRGIMGTMSVEEIYKDRKLFNERVFEVTSKDLLSLGLTVLSYTITNLYDDSGYLQSLGSTRTAQVMKDARIGEAEANLESSVKHAIANEELNKSQFQNKIEVAKSERDYMLNKAIFDKEVHTEKAIANHAYKLQEAKTRQQIREQEMITEVVERAKRIEVQEEEIKRRKVELEGTIFKPAEYEKTRLEIIAEAERAKNVLEAEAEAEAIRLKAEAQEHAILAKANAEYEQMMMKAKAFNEYGKAAILDQYLEMLPQLISNVANPLSEVKGIKMISSDSEIGASKMTSEISDIVAKIPNLVGSLTGVQIDKEIKEMKK